MENFTFDELADFSRREKKYLQDTFNLDKLASMEETLYRPGVECVKNILAYSKALSVRKSNKLHQIQLVLN
mgnify:CR=1 FL=1